MTPLIDGIELFPAQAGVILIKLWADQINITVPRASGGDPNFS